MITLEERGQGRIFFESVRFSGEQGDTTDKKYVFPKQCLVLGDSEVGKTSLVKSLTGKPFDPTQQKTQGIDQCLVDNEWKNCNLKDLVLGDLWKFLGSGQVHLLLGTSGTAKVITIPSSPWWFFFVFGYLILTMLTFVLALVGMGFSFTIKLLLGVLIFNIHHGLRYLETAATPFKSTSNLRFISATLVFMLSSRGFLIGSCLPLVMLYFDESYIAFASTRTFLMLGTGTGIVFVAIFILIGPIQMPFSTGRLVQNHNFIPILCFCRLLLSIFIGVIMGFVAATSLDDGSFECTETLNTSIQVSWYRVQLCITYFLLVSPLELISEYAENFISIELSIQRGLWGPFNILLYVAVFYHCKLAFTTPIFYFVITYPLFICLSFCQEWFRVLSSMPIGYSITKCFPNNVMTLILLATGKINTAMLKGALNERFPSLKLQILDFAGDKEYYAYHHMFLKSQAIYVIVFNVAKFTQNIFKNLNAAIERLQFWLESVCSHVPPKTPIVLVGTHRGDLDELCMQIVNDRFKEELWNVYCDELVVNDDDELIFFPVENSKGGNDVGVQRLRIKVMSVAEEIEAASECDIPLSWITIQDAIIKRREMERAKFCVTLNEFPYIFNNFICTNWSKETLKYFHEKGLVIYLDKDQDLSNWVLLKPKILVDIIIQLVTPPPQMIQERGFRRDWELLHDKGSLTKSLLTRIISTVQENEEAMTAFLEEYDLICPLSYQVSICSQRDDEEHQPTHFVPSLLPMSADGCPPTWLDDTIDKKFYVFFKRFLPEPLFHRLLSRAHKNSMVEFPKGRPIMFKDVGKFWMSPRQPYRLKLMKEEAIIEVTFSSSNMQGMKPADVLCQVFSMVDGICRRNFPFVKFHCGPACPSYECPGYQDNYMCTPYQHTRRHVYNVMPGRQGDNIASLYCVNNNFEDELKEWIP